MKLKEHSQIGEAMTPHPHERTLNDKYIASETNLKMIELFHDDIDEVMENLTIIRSHPSPSPDHAMIYDADHPNGIAFPDYVNTQRKDAAAQAREKVLKEFESRLSKKPIIKDGEGERCNSYELIEDMLEESLHNWGDE